MKPANFRWDYGDLLGSGTAVVVDRLMGTRTWKQPVTVATTGDVDLTADLEAGDTIDGVALAEGDRVLVWQQADPTQNGIYDVPDTGTASRSSDFDSSAEIVGAFVPVINGTSYAGQLFRNTNTGPVILGVDDITFALFLPASGTFELNIEGGQDVIKVHGSMGSTETFDPTDGNVHTGTLTADCTVTLNAPTGSGACTLELWITQDGTGGWDITWPGAVTPDGTLTPDTTAGVTVRYILETIDGGTSWVLDLVGGGGGSALTILDEGTPLATDATSIDFVGAGVVASGATAAKTVTISGVPTGAAGGDLSGTYPNPTISGTAISTAVGSWSHTHVNNCTFSGDGATVAFELPVAPIDAFAIGVYVGTARNNDWSLSGTLLTTLTFGSAPASGTDNISVDIAAVLY